MEEQDQPKMEKKVHPKDGEKKAPLIKQCCFHIELYLTGKEIFCSAGGCKRSLNRRQTSM